MFEHIGVSKVIKSPGFCDTCGEVQKNELLKEVYSIGEGNICVGCMIEIGELANKKMKEHLNKVDVDTDSNRYVENGLY